jgi:hypothetical protein
MSKHLAVFKLITNSNLVDCTTGKSEGLSPLRIRATNPPDCLNESGKLVPFRFRSKADLCAAREHVRFTPIATVKADFRKRPCLL